MKHIMIDLETLGTLPNSTIISIGATKFDPNTGDIGEGFLRHPDWVQDRHIDPLTVKWWLRQEKEAQKRIADTHIGQELHEVLDELSQWLPSDCVVWGNGATFDISILEDAYRQYEMSWPWDFWNVRDVRTVVDMAQGIVERDSIPFVGVPHDALDDAIHQAKYVSAMWKALRNGR